MNKVIITNARLTKDPDLAFAKGSGNAICKFGIAVNREFKKDEADFLNCVCFGKTAETIAQYMQKGSPINVEGSIQTGSYEKDGRRIYTTDIIVQRFEFVAGGKKEEKNVSFEDSPFDDFDATPVGNEDLPF